MTGNVSTVQRNTEARSCNHCCSGNAILITYSGFVFVALTIQQVMCMRHIAMCPVRLYNIFTHYLISSTIFGGGKLLNIKCVF